MGVALAIAFALGLPLLGLPSSMRAQETHAEAVPDVAAIASRLEAETRKILRETGIPAISIALVKDGEVAWSGAYGWASVGGRAPATTDTYFSTGSTFKFVTATAVMQLVERGLVTLDTPLNQIVGPELAIEGADDVTLRHLLSHHSGLRGPVGTVPLWGRESPRTPEAILSQTVREGPPGVEYRYCNECYAIAGHVIETLSGQPYDEYVRHHILAPLVMESTAPSVPDPRVVERMALPHDLERNVPIPTGQVRYDVFAAGDVYLRAVDMARFLAAHLNDGELGPARILSAESAREMRRPQFEGQAYGLGIGAGRVDGHDVISHSGAIPGFTAMMQGEPASRSGVYIMANARQAGRAIVPLTHLALRLLWGENPDPLPSFATSEREEVEMPVALLDAYVGEYVLRPDFVISVTREGDRLFVQATAQPRFEVFAASETEFFLRAVEASVTFRRDDPDGPVTHLVLHQGGVDQRAERRRAP